MSNVCREAKSLFKVSLAKLLVDKGLLAEQNAYVLIFSLRKLHLMLKMEHLRINNKSLLVRLTYLKVLKSFINS